MSTWWNSQQGEGEYSLQFGTDDKEKYKLVEKAAQMAIDGKTVDDFVKVKHAEWKWGEGLGGQYGIWCTNCGAGWVDSENAEWIAREHDYCPKCGARMEGGAR